MRVPDVIGGYYDAERGFPSPARNIQDAIGFADLIPEFLSLWLFKRKLLKDDMVVSHLNHIPVMLPNRACPFPARVARSGRFLLDCPQGERLELLYR